MHWVVFVRVCSRHAVMTIFFVLLSQFNGTKRGFGIGKLFLCLPESVWMLPGLAHPMMCIWKPNNWENFDKPRYVSSRHFTILKSIFSFFPIHLNYCVLFRRNRSPTRWAIIFFRFLALQILISWRFLFQSVSQTLVSQCNYADWKMVTKKSITLNMSGWCCCSVAQARLSLIMLCLMAGFLCKLFVVSEVGTREIISTEKSRKKNTSIFLHHTIIMKFSWNRLVQKVHEWKGSTGSFHSSSNSYKIQIQGWSLDYIFIQLSITKL